MLGAATHQSLTWTVLEPPFLHDPVANGLLELGNPARGRILREAFPKRLNACLFNGFWRIKVRLARGKPDDILSFGLERLDLGSQGKRRGWGDLRQAPTKRNLHGIPPCYDVS